MPQGCRIYLLVVSDHGRNNQMNDLTFYPLAKWVAENGGYVHWAWWNNLLNEYMAGPLGAPAPYPYPVPPTATEPHPLESFHKFNANPGTPTIAYPGLLERGWWRDGLPSLIALLSAFVEDVLEDAFLQNGVDPVPASDAAFVADARVFLTTIRDFNREALIITVGHGFGASSLNHLFETLTDTEIDLVGLIDPIGSEDSPAARRSDLRTHRGSQWRSRRKFLGYRQADCIRSTTFPFLCYDHAPGLFQWDYRCRPQGVPADTPSGWLDAPPTISSRAPLQCSGPVVHGGTLYRTFSSASNIGVMVRRAQPESRLPINPESMGAPLTCGNASLPDPIIKAIIEQGAEVEGALEVPEILQGKLNATLDCNRDDGHDELIGDRGISEPLDLGVLESNCEFDFQVLGFGLPWWSAIATNVCGFVDLLPARALLDHLFRPGNTTGPATRATGRAPLGSYVTGLGRNGLSPTQEYLASIGRPAPAEAWPACAICENGGSPLDARGALPLDMAYSANAEGRRLALVAMATPGPWSLQPQIPELCLVCTDLIEIASGMLDELPPPDDTVAPATTAQSSPDPNADGWSREDTVIVLTASDNPNGSGVRDISVTLSGAENASTVHPGASAEASITIEGITGVTFASSDNDDNAETPQTLVIKIDKTGPVIDSVADPPPNPAGWNNTDVTVSYSATDALSGLVSLSPAEPVVVTTEGRDQEIVGNAVDLAGNESSAGPTLSIDKTPPVINAIADVAPNPNGWNNTDVRVTFDASDALSDLVSSVPDVVVSAEGAGQEIARTAEDRAGNTAGASLTLNIDKTAPQIAAIVDAAPNPNGWNNADVRVSFDASDALSGLVSSVPDVVVSAEGAGQEIDRTAEDRAGNTGGASVTISIDKTAPAIALLSRTPANGAGWNNTDVNLVWTCSDALSGPVADQVSQSLTAEGAGQNAVGNCADRAGHTASNTQSDINIDKTSPVNQIATPAQGAAYVLNAAVPSAYGCVDTLSGVTACAGPVASGAALDTATVGAKTFTVSSTDAAGNAGVASHAYTVQYAFSGFSNPIVALPALNKANAGRTVPVKYSLHDATGAVIPDLSSFASLVSAPAACDTSAPTTDAEETDAAGSTTIQFDSGQFIYHWKTQSAWAGTCRVLQLTLNDGTQHTVAFQFR